MGKLKDGMLQGLKFDEESRTWYTKTWELKRAPQLKTAAEPSRTKLTDGDGLILYLTSGGSMIWRVEYRWQKTRKTYTIGPYTGDESGVSLMEAREALIQVKKWIKEGKDPSEEKRAAKTPKSDGITFREVAEDWYEHKTLELEPRYRKQLRSRLEKVLLPAIGQIPIAVLRGKDIMPCLRIVEAKGMIETAHKLATIASQICRYATILGHCEFDCAGMLGRALSTRSPKNRAAITDSVEIGKLLRAINTYTGDLSIQMALIIMPYVFLRSRELRGAHWKEIDLENGLWTVPAERMKRHREHIVPLAHQVVEMFDEYREVCKSDDFVFPSSFSRTQAISDMGLLNGLRRLGYGRDEMCIHGFRSMASTRLNEMGFRPDIIEMQLAHVQENQVRAAYNRALYIDERRQMMQRWADYLDGLRAGAGA